MSRTVRALTPSLVALRVLALALFGWIALSFATLAAAQGITTGTLSGTVTDPTGAVIPGAQIQLTNIANGIDLTEKSAADGSFKFFNVPIGNYRAVISSSGFSITNVSNVLIKAGANTDLGKVTLKLGAAEHVEVNGLGTDLLATTESQVTTTFDAHSMANLPLNNGFDTVAELIPGVVSTGADNFSNVNGDNYSVNGQSGRYNNFELDGQSNNDNSIGGPQVFFGNQDAIQELEIITDDYSAQYGRNAGAVENYITKSGTNAFHGSGFEFYQGQFLSSLSNSEKNPLFGFCAPGENPSDGCALPVLPRFVENRAGGTFGGPLIMDKLFFFGSTYWDRVREGVTPSQSLPGLTPDPTGLAELKAAFSGNPGVAALVNYGPYSIAQGNPQPLAVPADECSQIQGLPGPNGSCLEQVTGPEASSATIEVAGVQRSIQSPSNDQEELGRLDWQPTAKDHLFLRYFYQPQLTIDSPGGNGAAPGDFINVPSSAHSVGADWSHEFSSNFVDQLRYSFQQAKVFFQGGAFPNCVTSDLAACPAAVAFTGTSDDQAFGGDASFPQGRTVKVTQVQNNATWTHGRQTILFGGEFDYQNSPQVGLGFYDGLLAFGTLSNLLQNGPGGFSTGYSILADGNLVIPFTEPDSALYVQDDWKATPTLTLHLGLRWEFLAEAVDKLHDETAIREGNPATALWDPSLPLAARTVPYVPQQYKNFEPRVGLAWNPSFDKKLVVRAGYAINANPQYYNLLLFVGGGAPVVNAGAILCGSGACLPSNGSLLSPDVRAANLPFLPTGPGVDPRFDDESPVAPNFRTPYVQTYTLGIDHQFGRAVVGEVRYVGSKTTDDFQSINQNPFLLPVAEAFPSYGLPTLCQDPNAAGYGRPDCNFANVAQTDNGAWAKYNGLLLNLTTQGFHGLTGTASYTWSKLINNATDGFRSTGAGGSTVAYSQNPLDPSRGERGLSGNDFPNVVGLGFTYDVPWIVKGRGMLSRFADGFMLSGIYRYRSGQVYTPYQPLDLDPNTGDSSFCDGVFNSSSVGPFLDTCRLVVSNKKAPVNSVAYLNPYTGPQDPSTGLPTLDTPQYVVYGSDGYDQFGNYNPGTQTNPADNHWIINNQAYALSVNNPYPGSSRSLLRGPSFGELDATVTKTTQITERISVQISLAAYNALNQMYLGPGDANVANSDFTSNIFDSSGSASGNTSGNRFLILGGKVIF